jgi:hypothetical protein
MVRSNMPCGTQQRTHCVFSSGLSQYISLLRISSLFPMHAPVWFSAVHASDPNVDEGDSDEANRSNCFCSTCWAMAWKCTTRGEVLNTADFSVAPKEKHARATSLADLQALLKPITRSARGFKRFMGSEESLRLVSAQKERAAATQDWKNAGCLRSAAPTWPGDPNSQARSSLAQRKPALQRRGRNPQWRRHEARGRAAARKKKLGA